MTTTEITTNLPASIECIPAGSGKFRYSAVYADGSREVIRVKGKRIYYVTAKVNPSAMIPEHRTKWYPTFHNTRKAAERTDSVLGGEGRKTRYVIGKPVRVYEVEEVP